MKPGDIVKFGDIPQGTWFQSLGCNPRIFIKMQNTLPSGIKVVYHSFVIDSIPKGMDARHAVLGKSTSSLNFNAIDINGIPGSCPDYIDFEIIKCPF